MTEQRFCGEYQCIVPLQIEIANFSLSNMLILRNMSGEKKGVEDFGFSEIGGGLALISGFWGDLEKRGSQIFQGG